MANPLILSPMLDGIPVDLRQEARWVVWRAEPRRGQSKLAKVPYDPKSGAHAKTDNPATWGTYEQAVTKYRAGGFNGVGFMLGDGWSGVDLDNCIDPVSGTLSPLAQEIVAALASYTETSPSGTGVKIFVRGRLPEHHWSKNVKLDLEMYDQGRFFTVTGRRRNTTGART